LRQHVSSYWTISFGGGVGSTVRTLPDGCVELTFDLTRKEAPGAYVTGPLIEAASFVHAQPVSLLGVRFLPGGALPLLGVPIAELPSRWQPLDTVLGRIAHELLGRIVDAPSNQERVRTIDRFLCERLAALAVDARVAGAVARLWQSAGAVPIPELGRDSGASPRNLGRLFHEWVGMSPKRFARVVRFQRLLERVGTARHIDWSGMAAELGYFDQAHLIQDFSQFAGASPEQFVRFLQSCAAGDR
jgi:AraC-like DNA-binding protein